LCLSPCAPFLTNLFILPEFFCLILIQCESHSFLLLFGYLSLLLLFKLLRFILIFKEVIYPFLLLPSLLLLPAHCLLLLLNYILLHFFIQIYLYYRTLLASPPKINEASPSF